MLRQHNILRNDLTLYDQVEPWWDENNSLLDPLRRLAAPRMSYFNRYFDPVGKTGVDVGCGGGYLSTRLAHAGAQVIGIDSAPGAIKAAKNKARLDELTATYHVGSAEHLNFGNEVFDLVMCTDVLVHVDDPRVVLREMLRVLKPGGRLFFSSINRTWAARFIMIALAENMLRVVPKGTHDWEKFIKPTELSLWLRQFGTRVDRLSGIGPVGWRRGFIFGQQPFTSVMYQGIATKLFSLQSEPQ